MKVCQKCDKKHGGPTLNLHCENAENLHSREEMKMRKITFIKGGLVSDNTQMDLFFNCATGAAHYPFATN